MALVGNISGSTQNNSNIGISGSVVIANRPDALFPTLGSVGGDVVFFVSGSRGGKGSTAERTVSVFGGDAVVSGSLTIGTGSITITSNDITFFGGVAQIYSGSGGLTFKDSGATKTLAELATGGGDVVGPSSATDNALVRFDTTSGKLVQNSLITLSDLDVPNSSVTFDSDASVTTVNLFPTNATSVVIGKTAGAAGNVTVSGDLKVGGNDIQASDGNTNITLTSNTLTTFAGDIKVGGNDIQASDGNINIAMTSNTLTEVKGDLQVTGNDIKSSTGATAITLSDGNVIIPGDLTVNGTTTTVDVTTLTVEDPVIGLGFTSGSVVVSPDGDRGFIGGITTGGNVALFWDNTDSVFTSARTTSAAGNTVTVTSYTPFRASSIELGGTPGSARASNSAYLSSSDALNTLINYKDTTTFTKAGVQAVQITDYLGTSGEGMIKGVNAFGLAELWLSGTSVSIAAGTTKFVGSDDIRQGTITGPLGGNGLTLTAQDGTTASRPLVLSGSSVTLGANSAAQGVEFKTDGTTVMLEVNSPSGGNLTIRGGSSYGTVSLVDTNATTVNFAGAATGGTNIGNATGGVTMPGDLAVNGGDLTTTVGTFNLLPLNATTVNFAGAATTLTMGANSDAATTTIRNGTLLGTRSTQNLFNSVATTLNFAGAATTLNIGNTATGAQTVNVGGGSTGASTYNIGHGITAGGTTKAINIGTGGASTSTTNITLGSNTAGAITQTTAWGSILPGNDVIYNLGSQSNRWANIYTGDLHLKNDRGDYTIIEEEDFLSIRFNKSGKRYKFVLEPVPELDEK